MKHIEPSRELKQNHAELQQRVEERTAELVKANDQLSREIEERLRNENIRLRTSIKKIYRFGDIIGKSKPMQEIYEFILKAANSDANVVIYGESGTGKEMVARAIHDMSNRRDKVFVAVNCGAIPETLLESEFFGYKKGAFQININIIYKYQ